MLNWCRISDVVVRRYKSHGPFVRNNIGRSYYMVACLTLKGDSYGSRCE